MRQNKSNKEIREAATEAGVYLWRIAEELGISDARFSVRLRHELPEAEKLRVLAIIEKLSAKA